MKKTISTVLVLLLVLSTTTGIFATGTISGMHLPNRAVGLDNFGHVPVYYQMIESGEIRAVPSHTNTGLRMQMLKQRYERVTESDITSKIDSFSDMNNHWGKQGVGTLAHLGIVDGFPDRSFRPNDTLQLDQFLKLIIEGMGYELEIGFEEYWAVNHIAKAFEEGLIRTENKGVMVDHVAGRVEHSELGKGRYPNWIMEDVDVNTYDIDDHDRFKQPITRQEMAKIMTRAMLTRYFGADQTELEIIEREVIRDIHCSTGDYFFYITQAYAFGILAGRSEGRFEPLAHLTRAEGATVIQRFLDADLRAEIRPDLSHKKQVTMFTGFEDTWYTVFESYREPDIIDMIEVLEGNQDNTLGVRTMGASPLGAVVSSSGHESWEVLFEDLRNPYENLSDVSIFIDRSENPAADHSIALINPEGAMARHQEVMRKLMQVAFEDDFDEAWTWFNDFATAFIAGENPPQDFRTFNERRVSLRKGGSHFALGFSEKGGELECKR